MTPHTQLGRSDCWRTCIACLLDVPPEEVPDAPGDVKRLNGWLAGRGLTYVGLPLVGFDVRRVRDYFRETPRVEHVLIGRASDGGNHSVVARGGRIIHDPFPGGKPLTGPVPPGYPARRCLLLQVYSGITSSCAIPRASSTGAERRG